VASRSRRKPSSRSEARAAGVELELEELRARVEQLATLVRVTAAFVLGTGAPDVVSLLLAA